MNLIERTKELSNRLNSLMSDPNPGLISWNNSLVSTIRELYTLIEPKKELDQEASYRARNNIQGEGSSQGM